MLSAVNNTRVVVGSYGVDHIHINLVVACKGKALAYHRICVVAPMCRIVTVVEGKNMLLDILLQLSVHHILANNYLY